MQNENGQALVLLAEGRPEYREALQQVLELEFRVLTAGEGSAVPRLAGEYLPDLVILGALPPGVDLPAICAGLKAASATATIPVLLFASEWPADDGAAGLAAGALDYLTVPLRPLLVRQRVRNYLALHRAQTQAERLCREDALTGAAQRRYFEEYLDQEWRRALRTGFPLSLVLADLDQFRAYNERHGREAGDRCLRQVAEAIADCLQRTTDQVARYAGEEFACLLPETDLEGGLQLAERIRQEVLGLEIDHGASAVSPFVTVSLGVASIVPDTLGSTAQLLVAADRALVQAKEQGCNRVQQAAAGGI
jgi:diguanylate cyclase (GGDEF)-like protein